jgi:glycosyltransferase involved in cell wall biosynthesis
MTFIRSHAEGLASYRAVYAGAHRAQGLALPEDRVVTANRGGWLGQAEEFLFRRFGLTGRLTRDLQHFEPALVHAHFGQSGPAALAMAESLQIPLVVTFHGNDATITTEEARRSWRGREYLRGRQRVIERAALFIAVSEFIRSRMLEQGYPAAKVVTHHNGIDIDYFARDSQQREPIVVFVGRFVEKKGCEYLLRALGRLAGQGRPVRGVLLGDGPLRPELERIAVETGANVEFKGFLPLAEVRDWLGRASLVAVPSVTAANGDSEGLPTVILEAQSMGTPVVATRHAGNAEGVAEGQSALLVDERDVEGLADAIRFFMESPQAVETFGAAGRAFVTENFSIASQVEGLERIYDRVRTAATRANSLRDAA